mgnify:CR=1 FL=1
MARQVRQQARDAGVDLLIAAGPLAAVAAEEFGDGALLAADADAAAELAVASVTDGDTVLIKASRGVGLERVGQRLQEARGDG